MRSASSNRELSLRGARLSDSHAGDPTVQRAGDGPVDCLTAVPAGHGESQGGGVRTAWPPPTEGGWADRSNETKSDPVVVNHGRGKLIRRSPDRRLLPMPMGSAPSSPLHAAEVLRSDSEGLKIIRLLISPCVRFSAAALRRGPPQLVRCAARGPSSGRRIESERERS
jgi:hypothetical protein